MRIPRASADLKFLLGKSPIRAPGRRTRNGPFRISTTHSNVLSISKRAQKSEKFLKSLKYRKKVFEIVFSGRGRRPQNDRNHWTTIFSRTEMTSTWTSRGGHFGTAKTTSWAIRTDSAPTGATRKFHLEYLFTTLARFPISSCNFRQCHSLVFPREKLILRQIIATWKFPFLTSSGYSNAKWKNHKIFYFYKSWKSTSFDKRPVAVNFHMKSGRKWIC